MIQFFKEEDRAGITSDEFQDLTKSFKRSAVHLETRDAYGTATELPYMAKWAAGDSSQPEGWMPAGGKGSRRP
jgi:hypothetical protein